MYVIESEAGYLLSLYYLINWKGYSEEKVYEKQPRQYSTFESCSASSIKKTPLS